MSITDFVRTLRVHTLRMPKGERAEPISSEELSHIFATLISLEIDEGGPYALSSAGELDYGLNLVIAIFLASQGVVLPKVEKYLTEASESGSGLTSEVLSEAELTQCIQEYKERCGTKEPEVEKDSWSTRMRCESKAELKKKEEAMLESIKRESEDYFKGLSGCLRENAFYLLERTIAENPDNQMSLMPYYVREALGMTLGKKGTHFSDASIARLGLLNCFFWSAFIVYDDFWDEDESAKPELLPVANMFTRNFVDFFSNYRDESFKMFFQDVMDKLDMANAWELRFCRMKVKDESVFLPDELPDYGSYEQKYYPAAGHVLGPVMLFVECGYALDSAEVEALIGYFREYLIAMQLNDDAHDWKYDLQRGHISTAVCELLRIWRLAHPERDEIDLLEYMPELEELFWFKVLEPLCMRILAHAKNSRAFLRQLDFLQNPEFLEKFIIKNELAAKKALQELELSRCLLEVVGYPQFSS